jgi:hypothetical protein
LGKKNVFSGGKFCIIFGETFIFNLMFWEIHRINLWYKAFKTILVTFQKNIKKIIIYHTYLCLNEKPHLDFFCEITWVELVVWSWNGTIDTYSIYILWKLFKP